MLSPKVNKLYKYKRFDEYSLRMLLNNEIWFSKPSSFNDPFDCALNPASPKTSEDNRHQLFEIIDRLCSPEESKIKKDKILLENKGKETLKVQDEKVLEYFEEAKDIGILSLSEKNDSILMWSHYADNHEGFCIEFAREDNAQNILSHHMCRPVQYVTNYPNLNRVTHLEEVNVYTKAKEWEYEAEWRLVSKEGNVLIPMSAQITGIIFGLKACDESIKTIKNTLKGKDIKFYKAKRKSGQFALKIVAV